MPENGTPAEGVAPGQGEAAPSSQETQPSQEYVSRAELESLTQQITAHIEQLGERLKQSQRDSVRDRTQQIGTQVAEALLERLAPKLQEAGIDLEQERRAAWIDLQMQQSLGSAEGQEPSPQAGSGQGSDAAEQPRSAADMLVSSMLEESGLAIDEPEIRAYLAQRPANASLTQTARELAQIIDTVKQRKAGSAGGIGLPAGQAAGEPDIDELVQEYRQEAAKLRGQGMGALRRLQERMRKKGLPNPERIPLEDWTPWTERTPRLIHK